MTWSCLNRDYAVTFNHNLSFCPGSTVRGVVKPYFVTNPCAVRTDTLTISIANNFVFQRALFSGTRASYTSVVQFPDSVLRSLEPHPLSPPPWDGFTLKLRFSPDIPLDFPRNLAMHFGTHRTSILTPLGIRRLPPFLPDCRATIRQHIVVTYTNFPIVPPIFSYLTF